MDLKYVLLIITYCSHLAQAFCSHSFLEALIKSSDIESEGLWVPLIEAAATTSFQIQLTASKSQHSTSPKSITRGSFQQTFRMVQSSVCWTFGQEGVPVFVSWQTLQPSASAR